MKRHTPGTIYLGKEKGTGRQYQLFANVADKARGSELAQHVFVVGIPGSGKTTTLMQLVDGALFNEYAVVIVDCKGGGLGDRVESLAHRYGADFYLVDPDDPGTLGYDPCGGDEHEVSNKLCGAFGFSKEGEVYKQIALGILPPLYRALKATGSPVTLETLTATLEPAQMRKVGDTAGEPHTTVLGRAYDGGRTEKEGYRGLELRFRALSEGSFGTVFRKQPALNWDTVGNRPAATYIALRATGVSEDVDLMGRVIAQDLKQLAARRLQRIRRGEKVLPLLVIFDEFAALNEPEPILDLLRQARESLMPIVLGTQVLPETYHVRQASLSAGLHIVHRSTDETIKAVAAEWGTRPTTEIGRQIDFKTGKSDLGTVHNGETFLLHPNMLRNLPTGFAAVRSIDRRTRRPVIVQIHREA